MQYLYDSGRFRFSFTRSNIFSFVRSSFLPFVLPSILFHPFTSFPLFFRSFYFFHSPFFISSFVLFFSVRPFSLCSFVLLSFVRSSFFRPSVRPSDFVHRLVVWWSICLRLIWLISKRRQYYADDG